MSPTVVAVLGTWDTKSADLDYLCSEIERLGFATLTIDVGVRGRPGEFGVDVPAAEVAEAGGQPLEGLVARGDRGEALSVLSGGAAVVVRGLYDAGRFAAIVAMGGGGGTDVGTFAMRALPLGVPKLMVSTLASGDTSGFVDISDIVMMPAVVDVSGLNRISRGVYRRAAGAICGMAGMSSGQGAEPVAAEALAAGAIAVTMFGNSMRAANHASSVLEQNGFEVITFHATGAGGRTMEALTREGQFVGVLDLTTTEVADHVVGGVLSAGASRLSAASSQGLPQGVVPGCIDMCNFWDEQSIPSGLRSRLVHKWSPAVTLLRTNPEENARIGRFIAERLNDAAAPAEVLVPMGGYSELDVEGGPFWWPEADRAFVDALRENLKPSVPVTLCAAALNDSTFARQAAEAIIRLVRHSG